ncbi:hypothetical protein K502DRAFT_334836 [Neoconidiobolus thromboides FSU 785]|nr:hypothetical protein K502DRAFT_334836 [Neoconidiobolus thromboides FSU 785]
MSVLPWLLILGSSLSSIFGDIPVQRFTRYKNFSFSENKLFITTVLSLSGGILFYSSQMILLPEAYETVKSVSIFENYALFYTILFYSIGLGFILLVNKLISYVAPSAIACPCSHEESKKSPKIEFSKFVNSPLSPPISPGSMNSDLTLSERSPLSRASSTKIKVRREDVEQHNIMFGVGVQTAVAITLHKLPEGLITVMGTQSNVLLGLGLFIGIFCHNLPEGFMLAVPIYAATASRFKAFLFASVVGGLTQPLGGLLGLYLLDKIEQSHLTLFNAVLFPLTSGIMLMVILKSFLPAVKRQLKNKNDFLCPIMAFITGFLAMATFTHLFGDV